MKSGEKIGRYQILERIGKGGMAEIFRAEENRNDGTVEVVAIKRLFPKLSADREFVGMFVNEARIASSMKHANIVQTYDLIHSGLYYYIVMEYLEGIDLDSLFAQQARLTPLTLEEIAFIGHEVALGLSYAHHGGAHPEAGPVVHRDISPGNILAGTHGEVKITDFGIARAIQYASFTRPGVLKGKFEYMAPEYIKGLPFDGRADLFSLGVVLYELLTNSNPFADIVPRDIWDKVLNLEPVAPSQVNSHVPATLDEVVARALCKDVAARYQSGEELAAGLAPFFSEPGDEQIRQRLGDRVAKMMKKATPMPMPVEEEPEEPPEDPILLDSLRTRDRTQELHLDDLLSLVEPMEVPVPVINTEKQLSPTVPKIRLPAAETGKSRRTIWIIAIGVAGLLAIVASFLLGLRLWPRGEAYLTVESSQPAEVFVDKVGVGQTPLERLPVTPGNHIVKLKLKNGWTKAFPRMFEDEKEISLEVKWRSPKRRQRKSSRKPSKSTNRKTRKSK